MYQSRASLTHREKLHESQNTDGLKNGHSCPHLKLHPHSSAGIGLFWKLDFREMMLIFGLMLLLLQTAACLECNCRFDQKDSCYAALGHKLNLLMVDTSKYDLKIEKRINNNSNDPVCRVKNGHMKENQCDLFNNRNEVTIINGSLIINHVIRADSGNYTLKLDGLNGTEISADLQVNVEAPIGSVEVSISCSSNESKSVSCSSDGDQVIYSWTLNGESLMDGNTTIQLNKETNGDIVCSVENHVSRQQKSITVKHCSGPTTVAVTSSLTSTLTSSTQTSDHGTSFSSAGTNQTNTEVFPSWKFIKISLIALGCVSLILILLFIIACHFYKRKPLQSTSVPAGDTELVYAQISHDKHKKSEKNKSESFLAADVEYAAVRPQTKRKQRKEEEVQYGEVTFTPNHSNALQDPKEECVYSQVQRR